jgi:hypothetical protein
MENLKTYRNKLAQLKAGQERFASAAAHQAADERILAKQVGPDETVMATNGKQIPPGDYAIVEGDEDGLTVIASERAFFETIYELDLPTT